MMKKGVKLFMVVLMVVSVCSSFMLVASATDVPDSYLGASSYAITDGTLSNASQPVVKDGKMTFKINMASGLTVTGAMVTVKYDKKVLKIVDAGPATTTDADGNKVEVVTGMHTHGVPQYDDSAYTFAYISANGFKTGNTGKEYAYITFQVIDTKYPLTSVEFFAGDYTSTDLIKTFSNIATLDSGIISAISAGNKSISVTWNSVPGATEYLLYRKGGTDTGYKQLAVVSGITYNDTANITNNTTYTYAVRAKNATGYGWYIGKSFSYIDTVNITLINANSGVKIAWDKVDGATGYKVFKRVKGTTEWSEVSTVKADTLTITDTAISSGITYEYTACACKNDSTSALAEVKTVQYVGMVSKVTLTNAYTGVSVKWTSVEGAEKYRIYRKVKDDKTWTVLGVVDGKTLSYVDKGATSGKTNYYAIKAYTNGTWSAYKSYAINYLASPIATKTYSTVGTGNTLTWNAIPGAAKYRVYRKATAKDKWSLLTKTTGTSYTDTDVTLGGSYIYTLRAENGSNVSGYNSSGWTITHTLTTPSISKVTVADKTIKLTWDAVKGAKGYRIYRKADGATEWSKLIDVSGTSYTDKNVTAGVVYTYTIRAYSGKTFSGYDKNGWVGVILSTPSVKVSNTATGVKVSWSTVKGATGYTIYSSQYDTATKKWSSWKRHGTAAGTKSAWVDKSAVSGVTYRYTVRAVNGGCRSAYKASSSLVYLAQPTVTISNNINGITVKWTTANGATGYRVYRSQLDINTGKWSEWKVMGTAKSTASAWTDKSVVDGVTYKYTVRSVKDKIMSSYKATNGLMFLKAPELVSCIKTTEGVVLTFKPNASADSYRVYRKTLYTGWSLLEVVNGAENTVYTDKNVIDGTEYIYTVRAVSGSSVSSYVKDGISTTTN